MIATASSWPGSTSRITGVGLIDSRSLSATSVS
jgi:hypothetical protein